MRGHSAQDDVFPPEKRRVLLVSASRNARVLRGAEKQAVILLDGLRRRGWEVMLGAPPESKVYEAAADSGLPRFEVNVRPEFSPLAFWKLHRAAKAFRPTVLHLNDAHALSMGVWARMFRTCPLVVVHRRTGLAPTNVLKYTTGAHGVVAISRGVKDLLLSSGYPPSRAALVYSCVDGRFLSCEIGREEARRRLGVPGSVFLFTMIGAMVPHKDQEALIAAFREEFTGRREAWLYLAGDGSERGRLEDQVRREGMDERIRFPGALQGEELFCAYRAADVFVFATHFEGLGVAALEAQAMGLPLIASDVSGLDEAVADGRTGILVPPKDVPALKEAMLRLYDDADLRVRLGAAGPEWVRSRFSEDAMVEGVLAVYRRLARHRKMPYICSPAATRAR